MFTLRIGDENYDGFVAATFDDAAENICNKFSLKCAVDDREDFPVKRGASVELLINNTVVSTARSETVKVRASSDEYSVSVSGRDVTKSILKSELSPKFSVKGPVSFIRVLELCLEDVELSFDIVDEVGGIDDFTKKEIVNAEVGGNLWDLWKRLGEKRNVIISKNRQGKIVVRRNGDKKYIKKLFRKKDDPRGENNIVYSEGTSSDESRIKTHNVTGKENVSVKRTAAPPTGNGMYEPDLPTDTPEDTVPGNPQLDALNQALRNAEPGSELERSIDEQIAAMFPLNVVNQNKRKRGNKAFKTTRNQTLGSVEDELAVDGVSWEKADAPSSNEDCERIAKRKINDSRVKSITYICEVSDLDGDDEPWESGWQVDVVDEWCDVDAPMLIRGVSFETSIDDSSKEPVEKCMLRMTIPDAYGDDGTAGATVEAVTVVGEKFNQENLVV